MKSDSSGQKESGREPIEVEKALIVPTDNPTKPSIWTPAAFKAWMEMGFSTSLFWQADADGREYLYVWEHTSKKNEAVARLLLGIVGKAACQARYRNGNSADLRLSNLQHFELREASSLRDVIARLQAETQAGSDAPQVIPSKRGRAVRMSRRRPSSKRERV